jgi:hypothetical protein
MLTILVGLWLAPGAEAGCRQICTPQTSCDHLSGEERWRCVAGRSGETSGCRTVCSSAHGAIAYSPGTGASGWAYEHGSQAQANRAAMAYCARHAKDCRIVTTFANQCAALAAAKAGDLRSAFAETKREAETKSVAACKSAGGQSCAVVASVCSN